MGPMTRSPRDAALVMNVIADALPPAAISTLEGLRAGVPTNFFRERLAPEVALAYDRALTRLESAGAILTPITVPDPAEINLIGRVILLSEVSALMAPYRDRRADFGADVQALIDQGRLLSATDYVNAQRLRHRCQVEWNRLWDGVDVIFTPTAPIVAPLIGQTEVEWGADGTKEDVRLATTRFVRSINVLGLTAVSIPLPSNGLPVGLQIIGKSLHDGDVLAVAALL